MVVVVVVVEVVVADVVAVAVVRCGGDSDGVLRKLRVQPI